MKIRSYSHLAATRIMHFPSEVDSRFLTELYVDTDIEYLLDESLFPDLSDPSIPYEPTLLIASEADMDKNTLGQRNSCDVTGEDDIITFIESGELEKLINAMNDNETKQDFSTMSATCPDLKECSIFDEDIIWCQWSDSVSNIVSDENDLHDNNETNNQKEIIFRDSPSLHKSCELAERRSTFNLTCDMHQSMVCIDSKPANECSTSSVSCNVDIVNTSNISYRLKCNDNDDNLTLQSIWSHAFDEEPVYSSTKATLHIERSESSCEQKTPALRLDDYNECLNGGKFSGKRKRTTTEDDEAMYEYKRPRLVDLNGTCFVSEFTFADADLDITRSL